MKYFIVTKKHINIIKLTVIISLVLCGVFAVLKSIKPKYVKTFATGDILDRGLPNSGKQTDKDEISEKILGFSIFSPSAIISEYLPEFEYEKEEAAEEEPEQTQTPEKQSVEEKSVPAKSQIKNQTKYEVNLTDFENLSFKTEGKPKVLIVHTHTTESYAPEDDNLYFINNSSRSCENDKNMIAVGDVIENKLRESGIEVIHNTTFHDYPVYNGAYGRSLSTINNEMANNSGINVVLDIHRDAIASESGTQLKFVTEINGKKAAQVMLVIGTDGGGLKHPGWRDNLTFAAKIQKKAEETYPGLMRPLNLREERFNQHTTPCSIIIEVGTNANKLSEAKYGAELIAECIANILNERAV